VKFVEWRAVNAYIYATYAHITS